MEQELSLAEALSDFAEWEETAEQAKASFALLADGEKVRAKAMAAAAAKVDDLSGLERLARLLRFVRLAQ